MRTPVSIQREVLHLIVNGSFSNRAISRRLNITHKIPAAIKKLYIACGIEYESLAKLDDTQFKAALGSKAKIKESKFIEPDWSYIQKQMTLKDMTLSLLCDEYRTEVGGEEKKALSYSQFTRNYRRWLKSQRISMRQLHRPGDKMFVDFCGRTIPIKNNENLNTYEAQIFVAVLGGSGYTFVYAVESQKSKHWLECNIKAVEFFGGCPNEIVPDNLKSAVIKNTNSVIEINRSYSEFADHYDVIINPARPRKPKDKSLAEVGVLIVQRWVLSFFRNHSFYSIQDLNVALAKRADELNRKITKSYPESRLVRFEQTEKKTLNRLPQERFEICDWQYNVKVPHDYHIAFRNSYYSVPYQYINNKVDIKIGLTVIEIYLNRTRIASHSLREHVGISTKPEHQAPNHSLYSEYREDLLLEWAKSIENNTFNWAKKNLSRRDFAHGMKSVSKLKRWAREEQNYDRLESACKFALSINVLPFDRLKAIINNKSDLKVPVRISTKNLIHENIRGKHYYDNSGDQL